MLVWHRRAGKTFYVIAKMLTRALQTSRKDWRAYYIAPTFKQAKAIAWDMLKQFASPIPGSTWNEQELRLDLPNGARIQLLSGEQYDSLRGRYADDVTFDETALIPGAAWSQVVSPMLADRQGRATFIGTPAGRQNLLFDLFDYANTSADPDWRASRLTYTDTNVINLDEVRRLQRVMREEEFAQEMLCSWNAALRGAFYSKLVAQMEEQGRITKVGYEATLPVVAAVDLGWSDAMVVGFFQVAGTEHRCLKALAYEASSIPDMVRDWRSFPFPVDEVVLPHDAKVHELGTGLTRQETFHNLGCNTTMAPNQSIHEGINAVRDLMPHLWIDAGECKMLREAMVAYRQEFDEVKQVHRVTPVHDWSSHWCDMLRYYALGRPQSVGWGAQPTGRFGTYA